ncbi:MAG: HEAT repeat domain-containing protein [Anaeromyxobacter sp.]
MPGKPAVEPKPPLPHGLRVLRWVLVALLAVSAFLTLVAVPELREEVAASAWIKAALAAPLVLLGAFVVGFAVYRVRMVRLGRYEGGRALLQIALLSLALAVIGGLVLFPDDRGVSAKPVDLAHALRVPDPVVKSLAAEVVRHRPPEEARGLLPALVPLVEDPSPEVRRQAHATLVQLAGGDLGGEGPGAGARWREKLGLAH